MDDVSIALIHRGDQSQGVQIPGTGAVGGQGRAIPTPAPSKGKGMMKYHLMMMFHCRSR
jgi:hypothetical protein